MVKEKKEKVNAQELIDVVEKELEKKYDVDQQLCELVLKEHPELKKYIKQNETTNNY